MPTAFAIVIIFCNNFHDSIHLLFEKVKKKKVYTSELYRKERNMSTKLLRNCGQFAKFKAKELTLCFYD